MREIKYRAWDDKKKEMIYCLPIDSNPPVMTWDGRVYKNGIIQDYLILEQFTGRLDTNGNPIYEGDIVTSGMNSTVNGKEQWIPCPAVIKWDNVFCCWAAVLIDQTIGDDQMLDVPCEVIGNIHEPDCLD